MPVVETTWNLDDIEDDSEWTNLDSDEEGQQEGQEGEGNENPQPPVPQPAPSPPPVPAASRPRARVRAPPSAAAVPRAKPTRASTQAATKKSLERRETMITGPILNPARQTSFPVGTLVRLYNEGTIDLDPEYQRSVVWNADKQSALIESVYRNMHVPQLLFRVIRSDDGSETRVCIDGKQRLTSFKRFLNNEIPCKDSYSGKSFWIDKDPTGKKRTLVPPPMKSLFELKQVSCMEYEDVTPENERELFQRVQLGVSLSPADRLPAINGLYAELVRTLRNRVNTTKEFEGYLAWGRERGRDFQALAQIVHLILYGQTKKAEPTSSRLETLLRTTTEGLTAAQKASEKVMDIYCRIAQHPGLGEPLRKDLSPLEFVMSAYLIQLHRKKLSDTQLSDAITHMRTDAKQNLADFKFNTKNFKHIMSFLQKRIPKLIPNLKVDPNDPKPANDVKYQRIEVEVDQFKCLDGDRAGPEDPGETQEGGGKEGGRYRC
ncbi:unnamed protein product [Cyclocybe aegerita]|uniref:GmrSD restriction endonucleases N-terminal domain-containing protein n=1 Tax=Cyclocybe aegerita TaxID=1973307 RepID=A0A8S0VYA8_CYCAE|nr:unnamed protein product [Cyclocybe aegerita]